ncbi:MAG: helical backbone metal receptor [Chitinophagaceae bacterium]|nr:helical backbone metal receptor [Chitinophagaceae bacterium]
MVRNIDQMGNVVELDALPKRIISLVPSQTELLYTLGLDDEVIGITKFCIHPEHWFANKTRIGGTKTINIEKIKSLRPDLVIANKEENVKEQIGALQEFVTVWLSDVNNLEDALDMIERIGSLTGRNEAAIKLVQQVKQSFEQIGVNAIKNNGIAQYLPLENVESIASTDLRQHLYQPIKIAYVIWKNPYMTVGGDTFIGDMIRRCGFENVFEEQHRYPIIELQELTDLDCRLLLLSSEPFPFTQKHIDAIQEQLPQVNILLVDGEMFSWYGSRLVQSASYFKQLITQIQTLINSPVKGFKLSQ